MKTKVIEIKLMPEYQCWPLWSSDIDGNNVDPNTLAISDDLKRELDSWSDEYDATLNMEYPPDSDFPSLEAFEQFQTKGNDLQKRLQLELGLGYRIIYYFDRSHFYDD